MSCKNPFSTTSENIIFYINQFKYLQSFSFHNYLPSIFLHLKI
ncbi:hypothetical protein CPter91_2516 [Collimonas pratensis]|uniref:Uncharacterized protein n=1 Tax=Collimonas pratensis TaxID=279113 RepID=A0A127Q4D4_9BURK|nr:hypothetical protein CPter91_2516 [Collimonas pratensis]